MTIKVSAALRNFQLQNGSLKNALQNGKLLIYSGSQPATPEAAPSGTLLATITDASGAHTAEVQATGTVTLDSGASGSVDSVTVGGLQILGTAVPFNTSLTQTAADVAAQINKHMSDPEWTATSSGTTVTIRAPRGYGTAGNSLTVSGAATTIGLSYGNTSGGVAPANGLKFGSAAAGVISKDAAQTWSGVAGASGTAGWFRFVGSVADSGATDSTESQFRLDGSIATSGGDINMSSTTITSGATQTISSFSVTQPTN